MPQIESPEEARGVARLIQSGRLAGPQRDVAMQALREFDARHVASIARPDRASAPLAPVAEAAANIGSGMIAAPLAGLAGLGAAATKKLGITDADPSDVVESVQGALTYEPRTQQGQQLTNVVTYPFRKLGEMGDRAGEVTSNVTGSPAAGAAVNAAIQFLPALILKGAGRMKAKPVESVRVEPTISEPPEVIRAKEYVARNTSLDWNSLSDAIRQRLTNVAKDATTLGKLDPAALERQARLESLPVPVPATQGILTRNPIQLRNEGNIAATEAGKPIRDIHVAANKALLQNLEVLKGKVRGTGETASKAETPEQVGQSVQDTARAKLDLQKKKVSGLYRLAESKGELHGPVPIDSLKKVIETSPDLTHLGWVESWLKKTGKEGTRSLKELEDLRQAAVAKAMNGGTDGYYAGKVISAIDQATEGAGGSAYKSARAARKAQANEFENQAGVARLVDNASRTDRATALEDTWRKTVIGGSIQDLRNVKRSLLTGGDTTTRTAGRQAWRDLRAQTVQHIIDEATKSVAKMEDGTPNITPASMERAIKSVGPDKLEELFGAGTTKQLRQIMEATRDVKTEPPAIHKGSSTFSNVLAFLEKGISKVPVIGDTTTGAIRGLGKLREIGRAGREVRAAQETPLSTAENSAKAASSAAAQRDAIARSAKFGPTAQSAQQR